MLCSIHIHNIPCPQPPIHPFLHVIPSQYCHHHVRHPPLPPSCGSARAYNTTYCNEYLNKKRQKPANQTKHPTKPNQENKVATQIPSIVVGKEATLKNWSDGRGDLSIPCITCKNDA
ncbi:hypothetical protein VTJ04DRAFT_642 [Mycothermus thermophilus]|uniref:uncharacterized protein n=1 Tax=Humicola insolens TaxID=85995 RepID=UPI003743A7C3